MRTSSLPLCVLSRSHRPNIRPAIRQQPVLTVDGSNTEYVRLTSRSIDRTPTLLYVKKIKHKEMEKLLQHPEDLPSRGAAMRRRAFSVCVCECISVCVCSCGSSSLNAAEDEAAPGDVSACLFSPVTRLLDFEVSK